MRIQDILATHVRPGALVIDLTAHDDVVVPTDWLPPDRGVRFTQEQDAPRPEPPAPTVVVHCLQSDGKLDLGAPAADTVHVVLCERAETPIEAGLLDSVADLGWELTATHSIGKKVFPFAFVFVAADDATAARVRLVNEYRYDKLLLRLRTEHVSRLKRRLERARQHADDEKGRREAAEAQAEAAKAKLEALESVSMEEERAVAGRLRERVLTLSNELAAARAELEARNETEPADGRSEGVLGKILGGLSR